MTSRVRGDMLPPFIGTQDHILPDRHPGTVMTIGEEHETSPASQERRPEVFRGHGMAGT